MVKRISSAASLVKTVLALLLSIACVGLVSGCSCTPEQDTSLLTGGLCEVPCWHNITPGISDEDTVRAQLRDSPFVKKGTLQYDSTEQEGVLLAMFAWRDQGGDYNRIYLRDGKVLRIKIEIDYDLTLGEVVDKYGSPEYVYAYTRDGLNYLVSLSYLDLGLEVNSYTYSPDADKYIVSKDIGIVSKDLKVEDVTYFSPTSLRGLLEEVLLLSPDGVEYHMTNRHEWTGFDQVKLAQP
jgi:hypothetical protein